MKKIGILVFLLILFSVQVTAGEIKHDLSDIISRTPADEKIPAIIKFHAKPMKAHIDILKADGMELKYQYQIINAVAGKMPAKAVDKMSKHTFVKLIEPDYRVRLVLDKSIPQIQADRVWEAGITGKEIDVAVLDTGIHDEHPALTVEKEVDYTGEGTDDLHGHGTHVAGIVASTDSIYRGVSYDADLFNIKVLNKDGSGYGSDVIKGIEWAVDNGAEVISMSLGAVIDPCDGADAISLAVDNAVNKGVVAIVAAGNSGPDPGTITSPGCSKKGITIGAVDDNDNVPSWSSRGPTDDGRVKPDLVAPGVTIISTWNDNSFKSLSGTSMSTPHISGVAALLLEANSSLMPDDVKNVLKSTALDLGLDENTQGAGRVEAYAAIGSVPQEAKIAITEFKTDKTIVNPGDTFTLTLKVKNSGNLNAEGVSATLTLPDGLSTTDSLTKSVTEEGREEGIISPGAEATASWTVNADKEGKYNMKVDVTSTNDGSDSATTSITIETVTEENTIISVSVSAPESVVEKDPFYVIATVYNEGTITATGVVIDIVPSEELKVRGRKIKSLDPIESGLNKKTGWIVRAIKSGDYVITVKASADNAAPDEDSVLIHVETKGLVKAGMMPDSWMYGFKRFFEGMDMLFTFDDLKKAEKHIKYAELRLVEAKEMAEKGKPEFVDDLVKEYEDNLEKGNEISRIAQQVGKDPTKITELIAIATSVHTDVLEEVSKKVPEQAKVSIQEAIISSKRGNEEALNVLEKVQPKKAAEVHFMIAEKKLAKAQERADNGEIDGVEDLIEEYRERMDKSSEIAEIAKSLGDDTTNVEQLVAEATSEHLDILSEIHDKVPGQAKLAIENAMDTSVKGHERAIEALKENGALGDIPEEITIPKEVKEKMPPIAEEKIPKTIPREQSGEIEVEIPEVRHTENYKNQIQNI